MSATHQVDFTLDSGKGAQRGSTRDEWCDTSLDER